MFHLVTARSGCEMGRWFVDSGWSTGACSVKRYASPVGSGYGRGAKLRLEGLQANWALAGIGSTANFLVLHTGLSSEAVSSAVIGFPSSQGAKTLFMNNPRGLIDSPFVRVEFSSTEGQPLSVQMWGETV